MDPVPRSLDEELALADFYFKSGHMDALNQLVGMDESLETTVPTTQSPFSADLSVLTGDTPEYADYISPLRGTWNLKMASYITRMRQDWTQGPRQKRHHDESRLVFRNSRHVFVSGLFTGVGAIGGGLIGYNAILSDYIDFPVSVNSALLAVSAGIRLHQGMYANPTFNGSRYGRQMAGKLIASVNAVRAFGVAWVLIRQENQPLLALAATLKLMMGVNSGLHNTYSYGADWLVSLNQHIDTTYHPIHRRTHLHHEDFSWARQMAYGGTAMGLLYGGIATGIDVAIGNFSAINTARNFIGFSTPVYGLGLASLIAGFYNRRYNTNTTAMGAGYMGTPQFAIRYGVAALLAAMASFAFSIRF